MAPGNRDFKGQKHVFRKSIHKILTSQIDVGVTSTYHIQIALTTDRVIAPGRFIVNIHIIERDQGSQPQNSFVPVIFVIRSHGTLIKPGD